MSIDADALISLLEGLDPWTTYRVPFVAAELRKCGLAVTEMIKGNGLIVDGRRIEVIQPEWGEPGIYSLHLLSTVYEIITGQAARSEMEGRGFWYRDVLTGLKASYKKKDEL